MQTTEPAVKRPFHETIIDTIRAVAEGHDNIIGAELCEALREENLRMLAKLIKATKIPAGHLKIIAVWNWAVEGAELDEESFGVMADLLEQWQEASKENEEKAEAAHSS